MSKVAAIILAAGQGIRFGAEPKLLARLNGKSLVQHVAEAAVSSSARPVIAVTGHQANEVEGLLAGLTIQFIRNASFADGLSTSLRAGFAALPPESQAIVVLLGDMPLITADLIERLVIAWEERGRPAALVPTVDGRRGNPVVLSRELEGLVSELTGDVCAGQILSRHSGVLVLPIDCGAILLDVDTSDVLRNLQH